jgi:hypothetical protein
MTSFEVGAAAKYICHHEIPVSLASKLANGHVCPTCTITRHIKAVQSVQKQLVERGGAFASKDIGDGNQHRNVKHEWVRAKICLKNMVTLFEVLAADTKTTIEAATTLNDALEVWRKSEDALHIVLGMVYINNTEGKIPTEKDHEIAKLMIELLRLAIEKEMTSEDKEGVAKNRSMNRNEVHQHQSPLEQSVTRNPPRLPRSEASSVAQALSVRKPPRSILKRELIASSTSSPTPKRLRITDNVTISPAYLNTSNPSPFTTLPNTTTSQPHSIHSDAEHKRRRNEFHRRSRAYIPGTWASQTSEEKADTSYRRRDWKYMERVVRKDQREAKEEKTLAEGLKVVAGVYMGLWRFRKVEDVDLKVLRDFRLR